MMGPAVAPAGAATVSRLIVAADTTASTPLNRTCVICGRGAKTRSCDRYIGANRAVVGREGNNRCLVRGVSANREYVSYSVVL